MTPEHHAESDGSGRPTSADEPTDDATASPEPTADTASTDDTTSDSASSEPALDVRIDADRLATALDGAMAVADECRLAFDDGLVLQARDPADVAMAELRLDTGAFETYAAAGQTFGVALDRLRDAVGIVDDGSLEITRGERGRLDVATGAVEYTFAPLSPESVRAVEWIESETVASAVLEASDLRRAVRATDLVADHAAFVVGHETLSVTASGDTDDVSLQFDADDLESFDAGSVESPDAGSVGSSEATSIESLYSVDYLRDIVGAVPAGVPVSVEFVGGGDGGCPLALRHPIADGEGTGRWLLAPRIKR